jgi:hypothetical protein
MKLVIVGNNTMSININADRKPLMVPANNSTVQRHWAPFTYSHACTLGTKGDCEIKNITIVLEPLGQELQNTSTPAVTVKRPFLKLHIMRLH